VSAGRIYMIPHPRDVEDIDRLFEREGWRELDEPAKGFDRTWETPGVDASLQWLDDSVLGTDVFVVEGADRERVAATIREAIPVYEARDMPEVFARAWTDTQLMNALYMMAAVVPATADPALLPLFQRGFEHNDRHVRRRALVAAGVAGWPELRPAVERLAQDDPDADVRRHARTVLESFDRRPRSS